MFRHEQAAQADVLLRNIVVQQHPDSHDGSGARGDRGVEHEDAVLVDVLREAQVVQLEGIYLLRVSEANEVPISSHIWVGLSTFNWL